MNKPLVFAVTILSLAFGVFATFSIIQAQKEAVDFKKYDFNSIIEGNKDNGWIGDHIRGNPQAPVVLFEYADYQCPGCATMHPRLDKIIKEYGDKLGVVYRSMVLSYHPNSTAATSAAEAAGLQGKWEEYANLLFRNQSAWQEVDAKDRNKTFTDIFLAATDGKGDVSKFQSDMASKNIKRKMAFDKGISEKINVPGTPSLYLDGKRIDTSGKDEAGFYALMREKINAKLKSLGLEIPAGSETKPETTTESDTSSDSNSSKAGQ